MMEALRAAAPDQPVESVVENGGTGVPHVSPPKAVNPVSATGKTSWKAKCLILKGKCDRIDQSNDILYAKSRQIYKMIQRAEAEKRVLMRRLEQYEVLEEDGCMITSSSIADRLKMGDELVTPPPSFPHSAFTSPTPNPSETDFVQTLRQDMAVSPSPSTKPHPPTQTTNNQQQPPSKRVHLSTTTITTAKSTAKKTPKTSTKRSPASSRRKKNANSNAPKKPSNAFFWFCQEQRGSLEEQFRGEGVAGQHSLTKILAQKWGETTAEEKEKYYFKYSVDKKRYETEMQAYQHKKQQQQMLQEHQASVVNSTQSGPTATQ